jgi:hypothetical protein
VLIAASAEYDGDADAAAIGRLGGEACTHNLERLPPGCSGAGYHEVSSAVTRNQAHSGLVLRPNSRTTAWSTDNPL